jgi:poly(hydroxyalkanoate) granule-associated protein
LAFVFTSFRGTFPELRLETEVLAAEGPWVVARFAASGTQQSELFGVPGGAVRQASGVCCCAVNDQGITGVWVYADAGQLIRQFGLQPARAASAGPATFEPSESWGDRVAASTRDIWLAGLGALVGAGEQGERLFHALVEQGRKLESSGREGAPAAAAAETPESNAPGISERARRVAATGQEYIRDLASTLRARLDVPTRDEFDELRRKVDQLLAQVPPAAPTSTSAH